MKKILRTLFAAALVLAANTTLAQVETNPAHSNLDATWTEIDETSAQSDNELFLYGKSTVHFTVKNTSLLTSGNVYYVTTIEVKSKSGSAKGHAYYYFTRTGSNGNYTSAFYPAYTQNGNGRTAVYAREGSNGRVTTYYYNPNEGTIGETLDGTIDLSNGADDDYIDMRILDVYSLLGYKQGGRGSVILSKLSTSTTRYDIYDDKPLFTKTGENTSVTAPDQILATIQSNRIVDHSSAISVYVHRSLKSGAWGSFCLPFDVAVANMKNANALGHDAVIAEFDNVDLEHNIINFKSISSSTFTLKAGKPYLIQYNGEDKNEFFAPHVTFKKSEVEKANAFSARKSKTDKGYYFTALLEPYGSKYGNTTSETVGEGNVIVYVSGSKDAEGKQRLKKLSEDGNLKAFRAYLVYPRSSAVAAAKGMDFIDIDHALNGGTTAVTKVAVDGKLVNNDIYDLNGKYVGSDASNLPTGIYVRGGKKFVVK